MNRTATALTPHPAAPVEFPDEGGRLMQERDRIPLRSFTEKCSPCKVFGQDCWANVLVDEVPMCTFCDNDEPCPKLMKPKSDFMVPMESAAGPVRVIHASVTVPNFTADATAALRNQGYNFLQAKHAIAMAAQEVGTDDLSRLVRTALSKGKNVKPCKVQPVEEPEATEVKVSEKKKCGANDCTETFASGQGVGKDSYCSKTCRARQYYRDNYGKGVKRVERVEEAEVETAKIKAGPKAVGEAVARMHREQAERPETVVREESPKLMLEVTEEFINACLLDLPLNQKLVLVQKALLPPA